MKELVFVCDGVESVMASLNLDLDLDELSLLTHLTRTAFPSFCLSFLN